MRAAARALESRGVFEIGNSLREARLRQQLDFPEIERATKIRGKYLRALEDEQFGVLPGQTYVKGFLRSYAEYLGLDGQLYVDEYGSRYVTGEEEPPPSVSRGRTRSSARRGVEANGILIALTAIGVVTVIVIAAFRFSGDPAQQNVIPNLNEGPASNVRPERPRSVARKRVAPRPQRARLAVTAARGDCWLDVRAGSATGEELFAGTLEHGETRTFVGRRLWVNFGAPSNVDLRLNGRRTSVDGGRTPVGVVVTPRGIDSA